MVKTGMRRIVNKICFMAVMAVFVPGLFSGCGRQEGVDVVRVGGLKGPTSMGTVFLQEQAQNGQAKQEYEFTMAAGADELLPLMIKGELDIALIPANVAGVLYNRTEGGITVIDINTLGVLYLVSGDDGIDGMESLRGRTVYLTGRGTTPDYVLQYLLAANGIPTADCTLEYRSEATEVAVLLAEQPQAIGLLPQPFVTVACTQNEELKAVLDLNEQWDLVQGEGGSSLVTGVTVVRNAFLQEHPQAVKTFLTEHAASVLAIQEDPDRGAQLVAAAGIIDREAVAREAIPKCNIACIQGEDMRRALSGYLKVLYDLEPSSVGGALPEEDFYYIPQEADQRGKN